MEHGITEADWFALLEDSLAGADRARVLSHLDGCEQCRELFGQIRAWEQAIENEARILAGALARSPEEIDRMAAKVFDRIRACEPAGMTSREFRFGEAVLLLRALLDPLCGTGASKNAVRLATQQSCTAGQQFVPAENWSLFVRNLGAAIGAVYGVPARVLNERAGSLVGAEVC